MNNQRHNFMKVYHKKFMAGVLYYKKHSVVYVIDIYGY